MSEKIIIVVCAIVAAIIMLLYLQYFWLDKMFRTEQKQMKTQASLLLKDLLSLEVGR